MGVGETAMRRWVNQPKQEKSGLTPQTIALTPEKQRIQELEARIVRLEWEDQVSPEWNDAKNRFRPAICSCLAHAPT
ncbi:Uncharacterised protein [Plesiomonas shigelloides]|nr:Uncharacterised protein [Plesiomonas shigelloides]